MTKPKRQTALQKKQSNARKNTRKRSTASSKNKPNDETKADEGSDDNTIDEPQNPQPDKTGSIENTKTIEVDADESIQDIGYHPFNMPVTDRSYTKPLVDASELTNEIPEPVIRPLRLEELEAMNTANDPSQINFNPPDLSSMPSPKEPEQQSQFNPAFHDLSKKDKEKGAEAMADVAIDGYARLKKLMANIATISESRLDREIADGQIHPHLQLPIDAYGNTATIKEFADEWNNEVKEVCETSDEFKEEVKPMIVEEFMKRGVGMTNMQKLIYTVGVDWTTTTISVIQLRRVGNGFFESWRELSVNQGYTQPAQATAPRSNVQPQAEPPAQQTPIDQTPTPAPQVPRQPVKVETTTVHSELSNSGGEDGHFAPAQSVSGVPEFGNDPDLLEDMQKLHDRELRRKEEESKKNKQK